MFVPVAVERCGSFGPQTKLFRELGSHLKSATSDENLHQDFIQRISVAVQRGNTASVMGHCLIHVGKQLW